MNKKKNVITFAAFLDPDGGSGRKRCQRGIFSTIFSAHFQLSTAQLSQIVTVSYIGNLVFLAVGGFGVDLLGRRKAMLLYTFLWSGGHAAVRHNGFLFAAVGGDVLRHGYVHAARNAPT